MMTNPGEPSSNSQRSQPPQVACLSLTDRVLETKQKMVTALEQRDGKCLEGCISFLEAASITHQILKSTLIGKPVREVSVLTGCCRTAAVAEAGAVVDVEAASKDHASNHATLASTTTRGTPTNGGSGSAASSSSAAAARPASPDASGSAASWLNESVRERAEKLVLSWKRLVQSSQQSAQQSSAARPPGGDCLVAPQSHQQSQSQQALSQQPSQLSSVAGSQRPGPQTSLGIESGVGGEKKRERSPRREQESLLPGVKKLSTVASMTSLGSEAGGNPRLVTRHKLHAALSYDEGSSECEMLENERALKSAADLAEEIVKRTTNPGIVLRVPRFTSEQALHDKLAGPTGSTKEYAIQVRAILSNLKDGRNKDFKLKLRLGILDPALAPTLTAHDMASDDKRKEREKILQDAMDAMDLDYDKKRMKISSTFTCNKCNTNRCTYYQLQTRSSDEPMTTFVTCQTCGNRWKFC